MKKKKKKKKNNCTRSPSKKPKNHQQTFPSLMGFGFFCSVLKKI